MSTEQLTGGLGAASNPPPITEAPAQGQEPPEGGDGLEQTAPQASEVEEIAREMGWAPEADWKGPREAWKTAKEFIRHGTVIQRELKSRNDAQLRDFESRLERMDRSNRQALANQRAQIESQYEARKRDAVRNMDEQAYDAAQRAQTEALKNFDAHVEGEAPQRDQPGQRNPTADVIEFGLRNKDWFNKDPVMTGAAVALDAQMGREYPQLKDAERLMLVENEIKRRFGNGGGGQPQNGEGGAPRTPQVEGGLRPIKTTKTKGWAELPAEAKQVATRQIKEGLFKSQDEYAKSYWEQE
jgi:hypothetical protein